MAEQSAGSRRAFAALERRADSAEQRAEAAEARAEAAERRAEEAERRLREGGKAARHAKDEPTYRATMDGFRKRLEAVERRLLEVEAGQRVQVEQPDRPEAGDDDVDVLYGVPAIAKALGLGVRQARHLADRQAVPTFRILSTICARRSTLNAWLAAQEGR